jgi:hypothetical protein
MNTVKVYVKKNGVYTEIEGNVVNITTDELLDEQLDQSRLEIINSPVDNYPPLTEFKFVYYKDGEATRAECFISGDPKSNEYMKP